eukprot:c12390_g1_i1 orf=202-1503(-)
MCRFSRYRSWRAPSLHSTINKKCFSVAAGFTSFPRMQSNVPEALDVQHLGKPSFWVVEGATHEPIHRCYSSSQDDLIHGYSSSQDDLTCLISRLCDKDKAMEAFKLLSMMNVKDLSCKIDIYNKVLDSLVTSGNISHALQLFEQMKGELHPNQSSYVVLFTLLCKAGRINDACRHLDDMVHMGFVPETNLVNSLVNDFCKAGKWKACHQILAKMCDIGHIPPLVTFNVFFSYLCRAGLMQQACKLLDDIIKLGFSLDVYTYSIMIHSLCKADKVDDAYKLLKAMRNKNCTPDVVCYSTVLHGYVRLGKQEPAIRIIEEMRTHGCEPDIVTYNSLISMFSKHGDTDKAFKIWGQMRASGCIPDHISYTAMLDGLCRRNKAKECLRLLAEMLKKKLVLGAPLQRKLRDCIERHGVDAEMDEMLLEIKKLGHDLKV